MRPDETVRELRRLAENSRSKRDVLIAAADRIEELQRRGQAAVDDLYEACKGSPCNNGICVKKNCTGNHIPCEFEWRGPQEAGEGEAE